MNTAPWVLFGIIALVAVWFAIALCAFAFIVFCAFWPFSKKRSRKWREAKAS